MEHGSTERRLRQGHPLEQAGANDTRHDVANDEQRRRQILTDPARLAALEATGLLVSEGQGSLERLAALAARTLRVPLAQVNFITADTQVPIAVAAPFETDARRWRTPVGLEHSFCQYTLGHTEPLVIDDARGHPLVAGNRATTDGGIMAYAAAPVVAATGEALGTVCIVDFRPRKWTIDEIDTLREFAALASSDVALVTRATTALGAADRELGARGERLEAERAHLMAVIEQMPLGVALAAAPSGRLLLHNAEAVRILRHPMLDAPDVAGYVQYGAQHSDGTPYRPDEYPIARAAQYGETITQHIMHYRRGDGSHTVLAVNAAPVQDGSGQHVAAVSTFEDIAARTASESALRVARDEAALALRVAEQHRLAADLANQAKGDFLAMMSHEMRTPLQAIVGYAELMALGVAGAVTPTQREYLERQRASSNHLLQLVNDLLDQVKEGAGALKVAREQVSLLDTIQVAMDLTRPQAAARGVLLESTCGMPPSSGRDQPLPATVGTTPLNFVGDEHRVRQILLNLLSNAVKFTPAGGKVTLTCGGASTAPVRLGKVRRAPWVFVSVTDTGIGIPEPERIKVFEPFHRVLRPGGTVHTRIEGGTGLGLPISRRLARLMGGDLLLESEPGRGSTFTVWLPAAAQASAPSDPEEQAPRDAFGPRGLATSDARRGGGTSEDTLSALLTLGERLRASSDAVLAAYVERLRGLFDHAETGAMRRTPLEDHAFSLLAELAQSLIIAADADMDAAAMLHDGSAIQRTIAEQHGARRFHQGWALHDVRRDYVLLRESLLEVLGTPLPDGGALAPSSEALGLLSSMLERAEDVSARAWRTAHLADVSANANVTASAVDEGASSSSAPPP